MAASSSPPSLFRSYANATDEEVSTAPQLFVTRHGERIDFVDATWWDRSTRPFDPHLSPHGYEQAKHLAGRLLREPGSDNIKHILCSPYVRCIETIYPFATANGIPIKIEYGLSEWFGEDTVLQDIHMPLSPEELRAQFPLVDLEYKSKFDFDSRPANEQDMHERLYRLAQYVTDSFYSPTEYSGDVCLVTHAAGVIAAVRGLLSLKTHPSMLDPDWYAAGGPGRVRVYAGVSAFHKLAQQQPPYNNWVVAKSENSGALLDPERAYNWAYKPDRRVARI